MRIRNNQPTSPLLTDILLAASLNIPDHHWLANSSPGERPTCMVEDVLTVCTHTRTHTHIHSLSPSL